MNEASFETRCVMMNQRYELPVATTPTLLALGELPSVRLAKLRRILQKELDEIEDVINKAVAFETGNTYQEPEGGKTRPMDELEVLTDIADLMVDLQVYQVSEMVKFGIPLVPIQNIVMDSNESKLDVDGRPLKDADGKFLKGPNYWKPEPAIRAYLERLQTNT
jgi:predicted HAD superfamily Cof-like phosphohydrolase